LKGRQTNFFSGSITFDWWTQKFRAQINFLLAEHQKFLMVEFSGGRWNLLTQSGNFQRYIQFFAGFLGNSTGCALAQRGPEVKGFVCI